MQKSIKNLERVGMARELLEKGLSKKLIAQTLGISPSHLSHLLKRS
jgi:predicted transcriptional regulator